MDQIYRKKIEKKKKDKEEKVDVLAGCLPPPHQEVEQGQLYFCDAHSVARYGKNGLSSETTACLASPVRIPAVSIITMCPGSLC